MINIAFITDNNYLMPTSVAIRSLIDHTKETDITLYIISDLELDKRWKDEMIRGLKKGMRCYFICAGEKITSIDATHIRVTKTALLKFWLPELLPELDKVLYLDGDIIVKNDITELYMLNVEPYYAAVVKDMLVYRNNHIQEIGVSNYFNSGVMLLNLKKLRKDKVREKLLEAKKKDDICEYMDQDAFNVVFDNEVLFIHPKYNHIAVTETIYSLKEIQDFYEVVDWDETVILHLAGLAKPWESLDVDSFEEWILYINSFGDFGKCLKRYYIEYSKAHNELGTIVGELQDRVEDLNQKNLVHDNALNHMTDFSTNYDLLRSVTDRIKKLEEDYVVTGTTQRGYFNQIVRRILHGSIVGDLEKSLLKQTEINAELLRIISILNNELIRISDICGEMMPEMVDGEKDY